MKMKEGCKYPNRKPWEQVDPGKLITSDRVDFWCKCWPKFD